jgi:enoyl-CoA hydratase
MTELSTDVILETRGSIATLTFNRPADRNSLTQATINNLEQLLNRVLPDPAIKVVVFTGTDDVFLSGANIRELIQLNQETALRFSEKGQQLFERVANAKQATIAAVNGYCMGGGLDFALACDVRIASKNAQFAHPGARLGIITGWGGTQRLPRVIGKSRALEVFATTRRLMSEEALQYGLITEITDPVMTRARELAEQIAVTAS